MSFLVKIDVKFDDLVMPTTGETCKSSGVYKCAKHPSNEIPLSKGETFPPCRREGGHSANWVLVRTA